MHRYWHGSDRSGIHWRGCVGRAFQSVRDTRGRNDICGESYFLCYNVHVMLHRFTCEEN